MQRLIHTTGNASNSDGHCTPAPQKAKARFKSVHTDLSDLSFVSKTLERLVNRQYSEHIDKQHLLPDTQSTYRQHHSTETALVKMHNE